jgi:hypothetical protein
MRGGKESHQTRQREFSSLNDHLASVFSFAIRISATPLMAQNWWLDNAVI